jgi:hypothetical protein
MSFVAGGEGSTKPGIRVSPPVEAASIDATLTDMDIDLTGAWQGWRIRGGVLISPDQDRITVRRLHGLVLTEGLRHTFGPKPVRQGDGLTLVDLRHFRDRVQGELRTR